MIRLQNKKTGAIYKGALVCKKKNGWLILETEANYMLQRRTVWYGALWYKEID